MYPIAWEQPDNIKEENIITKQPKIPNKALGAKTPIATRTKPIPIRPNNIKTSVVSVGQTPMLSPDTV